MDDINPPSATSSTWRGPQQQHNTHDEKADPCDVNRDEEWEYRCKIQTEVWKELDSEDFSDDIKMKFRPDKSTWLIIKWGNFTNAAGHPDHVARFSGQAPKACEVTGYESWYRVGSHCVKYFSYLMNFSNAEHYCRSVTPGGHLVSLHNYQANRDVLYILPKHNNRPPRIWLGGFELFMSGKFIWTDGSTWDYSAWAPGEPTYRHKGYVDCLEMNASKIGMWYEHYCFLRRSFVCSFKPV
ncbi:lectin-like [Chanos chanos]|uniref:Lectin-like n=1 Tax=Chanos chanos TaxID=29144 RepID=A0A6J2W3V4_CHACN|nr:lectin-like [Chanos chanos]